VSDGQSWSGEVAKSLALAQGRGVPLNVVGIGTTAGGIIPDPKREANQPAIRSVLNRAELTRIATAGGGRVQLRVLPRHALMAHRYELGCVAVMDLGE